MSSHRTVKRKPVRLVDTYLKKYAFGSCGPIEDETVIGGYPMQNDTASGDYNAATDWTGVDRNASKPDKNKKSWGVSRQQVGNGVMAAGQIVRSMNKTTFGDFRDDTDDFTDGAMNVVGQAGPWGALVAGIYNIVQPISKGVRKRTEATDAFGNLTGSKRKINRTATLGAILSPSQAIANRIALNYYKPGWGGYADALQKKLKEEFNEKQAPYVKANRLYAEGRAGLQGDYAQGIKGNQYYAHGGSLVSSYLKANGGNLKQLSKSTVEVQGPSHEEGGVQLPQVGAEVEGNETISNGYVFSDRLGFAQEHKKLATAQGKIEDKPATRERLNTLKLLQDKEAKLAATQEYLRKTLNLQ